MPFKSEEQRRYLWANEPEIARDWTDTYGSRIQKDDGGIMRIPFAEGDISWSSKDDPKLHQKMNEAVNQAVQDYLEKINSGEISFPDNLQLEMDKIGNRTRHDLLNQQSDQPEIFSESLQEGIDTSNIKQKQKRSREQQLLDDILNQQSNVGGIKPQFASFRTAGDTAAQDVGTYPYSKRQGIEVPDREAIDKYLANNKLDEGFGALPYDELDDYEAQDIDRERIEELRRLASMEQYPTETEDEQGNWLTNLLNPQNIKRGLGTYAGRKLGLGALTGPLGWMAMGLGQGTGLSNLRGGHPTQNAYEQARQNRILQGRKEYMMGRREKGLDYGNLANVFQQLGEKDTWVPPQIRKPTAPTTYIHQPTGPQQQNGGGGIPQVARDLGMRGSYDHGWT